VPWVRAELRVFGLFVCGVMRCRLQQLTEFDCFIKSFTYLAARLPRSEFLEPFLDEAIAEPVESIKKRVVLLTKMKELNLSETLDINENAFMQGIQLATGKPPEAVLEAGQRVPLSEAEPDMYPCLLASCGSSFIFLKVCSELPTLLQSSSLFIRNRSINYFILVLH